MTGEAFITGELHRFHGELIAICKALGDADMESDDRGDRWLSFERQGMLEKIWGQVRATYMGDTRVWEITLGYRNVVSITDYVERKNA